MGKLLVYMAGKIGKNDWRHNIFTDLRHAENGFEMAPVQGFHYCGPYFIKCDHGCYHGENSHGRGLSNVGCGSGIDEYNGHEAVRQSRYNTINKCLRWIETSSVVFAWIDKADAYGTLTEIGYAAAKEKPVFVGISSELDCYDDMWFPSGVATVSLKCSSAEEAWHAFVSIFDKKTRKLNKELLPKVNTSNVPATDKQKKYLTELLKHAGYKLKIDIDDLNLNQASLLIAFFVNDDQLPPELMSLIEYDI